MSALNDNRWRLRGPAEGDAEYEAQSSGKYSHRTIAGGIGYNLRPEASEVFAQATVDVDGAT